jgi:signal transduction histidine kinase
MSLVQAEKLAALGSLVAGIAHEINTPLGIALTSASLLSEETRQFSGRVESGAVKKSDLQQFLRVTRESTSLILGNAERAASLVHSFKQVAVDQTSEARREFDLAQYIDEVIDSLRPKFKRTPIRVVNDCPRDIRVDSYPGAVAQIVTNLLLNALIHAFNETQSGQFQISAQLNGRNVKLCFADDGRGIGPEHLSRIFEPFFTTRRGAGGTGLGLHIVYNIVTKRLGGHIEVESEPGQGTRFTLTLPLQAPEQVEVSDG